MTDNEESHKYDHVRRNGDVIQWNNVIARPLWSRNTAPWDYIQIIDEKGRVIQIDTAVGLSDFFRSVADLVDEIREVT